MSPVKEGFIEYSDLHNGGLTLFDIQKINEAIAYYPLLEATVNKIKEEQNGGKIR